MPTTTTEQQKYWDKLTSDPSLADLPYKVETDESGKLVLTPHTTKRSRLMGRIMDALGECAPEGMAPPSYALATPQGVKVPDVVWMSPERKSEMEATGDPSTMAPEICIEVTSEFNTEEELEEKRALYLSVGAEEVWIIDEDGRVRFFGEENLEQSAIAPNCPDHI